MKYDLYFHNDLDGHASAAIFLSFLRGRGDDAAHYTPLDFDILPQWSDERFFQNHKLFRGTRYPAIVLDFPYHPAAAFWFDHHPTAFKKDTWQKAFKADRSRRLVQSAPSCAGLVYGSLKKDFGWRPPKHLGDLVRWLDVIDAARYRSAQQTILMKEPALKLDAYIENLHPGPKDSAWLVGLMAEKPLARIVAIPRIKKVVEKIRKNGKAGIKFYRKNIRVAGNATVIELAKRTDKNLRFAPNYLFPKVLYNIRLYPSEGYYRLGVGVNPWKAKKNNLDIGGMLKKRYDGGGHKNVGGVEFKTKQEAERAVEEILRILQKQ